MTKRAILFHPTLILVIYFGGIIQLVLNFCTLNQADFWFFFTAIHSICILTLNQRKQLSGEAKGFAYSIISEDTGKALGSKKHFKELKRLRLKIDEELYQLAKGHWRNCRAMNYSNIITFLGILLVAFLSLYKMYLIEIFCRYISI